MAPWIIEHFPAHNIYVEPFAGGASVLLAKEPSPIEVYNDAWDRVVSFFRVLRERPAELVSMLELSPWSRAEFYQSFEQANDPLEDARRFFINSWQGIGGTRGQDGPKGQRGWRFLRNPDDRSTVNPDNMLANLLTVAARLRHVQIECDDALTVMRRYDGPDTLHYIDPPYTADTRRPGHQQSYFAEMTTVNHRHLALCLRSLCGHVVLSGYASPLYDELYGDWRRVEIAARDCNNGHRVETLWLSPSCEK